MSRVCSCRTLYQIFIIMQRSTWIAYGHRTPKESPQLGIRATSYFDVSEQPPPNRLYRAACSITEGPLPRGGTISLSLLAFLLPFLFRRQAQLALGVRDQRWRKSRSIFGFIGTHTWEELCREWLLAPAEKNCCHFCQTRLAASGTAMSRSMWLGELHDKTLILGECKWDRHAKDASVLANLSRKQKSSSHRRKVEGVLFGFCTQRLDGKCIALLKE